MTEKITVKIGITGRKSSFPEYPKGKNHYDMAVWLSRVLEISHNRAVKILDKLKRAGENAAKGNLLLVMDYRQLGRYTAKLRVDGLIEFWAYPHVEELIEDGDSVHYETVEVRQGHRH